MGLLDMASRERVYRGYEYCKEDKVAEFVRLSDCEFEGKVEGSRKEPYTVFIDTKHPKKSSCDCPFANGNKICKHMVALFFKAFPEEYNDYASWMENDYEEPDDYYDEDYGEYDYYDDDYDLRYNYRENKLNPVFFDEILENYLNSLSKEQMKDILKEELSKNKDYVFNKYLKNEYKKYINNNENINNVLEAINKKFYPLSHDFDYNYKDYTVKLLSKNQKNKISESFDKSKENKQRISAILLNPELATYDDYKWIAKFYKEKSRTDTYTKKIVEEYISNLKSFFDTLKHYSIKNTLPKSNVLITMYLMKDYKISEIADLLIKHSKYYEFIDYIIFETNTDIKKLYKVFDEKLDEYISKGLYFNKKGIAKNYNAFYLKLLDDNIYAKSNYYDFLATNNCNCLRNLKSIGKLDYYVDKIKNSCKDFITLAVLYVFTNKKDDLLNLLLEKQNEYYLLNNIDEFKQYINIDDYKKIIKVCTDRFYEVLKGDKSRDNYKYASNFIKVIKNLEGDDENTATEIVEELRKSEYAKRRSLFEEIENVILDSANIILN